MRREAADIRLVHRVVGTKLVFTSPDVPELHVSHADHDTALNAVHSALAMFDRMRERQEFVTGE